MEVPKKYSRKYSCYGLACVASVSNRVITRPFPSPSPVIHFIFCSCPSFLDEPREETLATQASYGLKKKIHTRNFGNEKKFLRLENSLLPP